MSTKTSILLTRDNEHFYFEGSEPLVDQQGRQKSAIVLEFDKANIRVDVNDDESLVVKVINPDSELYAIFDRMAWHKKASA